MTTNIRHVVTVGLAATTLAVVLTYVVGAQAILQSAYTEPAHDLFMSAYMPLIQGITGHAIQAQQMHGGPASESQMQSSTYGIIGNNVLGSPAGLAAAGLAAVVVMSAVALATAAFVVSWKLGSFTVAGLLVTSGIILTILPLIALANKNFAVVAFQGPIVGVTFGLTLFGLGIAKAIGTARGVIAAPR